MITENDARTALADIDRVTRRTRKAGAYAQASPHLVLAGAIWVVGYVATGLTRPEQWLWVWLPLMAIGLAGAFALGWRGARAEPRDPSARPAGAARALWLCVVPMAIVLAFVLAFPALPLATYLALPAFLLALIYALAGLLFALPRFLWIGTVVGVVTLAGLVLAPGALPYLIAAAGGGGLVVGGLWMRRV